MAKRLQMTPLVSIVLTCYNGEQYLAKQLDSITNQTYSRLEIIVCDDASTDRSRALIRQAAERDARIHPVFHPRNLGLHKNLESGLKLATGTYIAISDQDDIWRLDKVEKLLGSIGDLMAIFSDSELIDSAGQKLGKTVMQSVRIKDAATCMLPKNLVQKNAVSGHALLFHRSLLSKTLPFSDHLIFDHHLAIAASIFGGLTYYPEPLVLHRIHGTNHTNSGLFALEATARVDNAARRRQQYISLFAGLNHLLNCVSAADATKGNLAEFQDVNFRDTLAKVVAAMKKNQNRFFDLHLFLALLRFNLRYHYFGLRQSIKLCKGRYWYTLTERFGFR